MRILMAIGLPCMVELGAARVQLEIGHELRKQGHDVDHYCLSDALAQPRRWLGDAVDPRFPKRALRHIRRSPRYDVIDVREGDLPFAKARLGFEGLLVSRSVGLSKLYRDFRDHSFARWPDQPKGNPAGQLVRRWHERRQSPRFRESWEHADLVNMPNGDEAACLDRDFGLGHKTVVLPYGTSPERREELRARALPPTERLASGEVVFIGYWSPRKGSLDWGRIVRATWRRSPRARFSFLGTGLSEEEVLGDLGLARCDRVNVVTHYTADELPVLLREATVAALPSYVEGFGFAVLEQLAAGIPTVAYDAPGQREMLRHFEHPAMVQPGDVDAFAEALSAVMETDSDDYRELSERCIDVAARFTWETIAAKTADVYAQRLGDLTLGRA